jgi:transposase
MPAKKIKIPKRDSYDPTPSELEKLRELVDKGVHTHAIFREMRISATVGYRWLSAANLEPARFVSRNRNRPLTTPEEAEFRSYYKTSPSRMDIYRKYNIKTATLNKWLKQLGLEPPKPDNARSSISTPLTVVPESELYCRLNDDKNDKPWVSIADRFRAQGLATYSPDRA